MAARMSICSYASNNLTVLYVVLYTQDSCPRQSRIEHKMIGGIACIKNAELIPPWFLLALFILTFPMPKPKYHQTVHNPTTMICHRCLLRLRTSTPNPIRSLRPISTSAARAATLSPTTSTQAKPRQNDSASSHGHAPPSATSTSAAQPFSTPLSPSPKALGVDGSAQKAQPAPVVSSVPAGTPLKGLNFLKGGSDPVAREDHEYPGWLWAILTGKNAEGKEDSAEGDLFCTSIFKSMSMSMSTLYSAVHGKANIVQAKSKKQRRLAAKKLRKQALLNPEMLAPKVPLYEQSVDLPKVGVEAGRARAELTRGMREKRRKDIKEANFLRAMG